MTRVTLAAATVLADDTIDQIGTTVKVGLPTIDGGMNRYEGTLVEVGNGFLVVEFAE